MRKQFWVLGILAVLSCATIGQAQQVDFAFGVGTILAPSASSASGNHSSQSLTGGAYPAISGDFLFHKNFGIDAARSPGAPARNIYQGNFPYRPLFWGLQRNVCSEDRGQGGRPICLLESVLRAFGFTKPIHNSAMDSVARIT